MPEHQHPFVSVSGSLVDPGLRPLERYVEQLPDPIDRLARLRALLPGAPASLAGVRSILSDHAGCPATIYRHGGSGGLHTLASVIFEPSRRRMHIAYGNPSAARYDTYCADGTKVAPVGWHGRG